jgi:outer membrane protein TolC
MRIQILLGLTCGVLATASAQTTNAPANPRPLSLHQCIELALSHNLDLRIEHLTVEMAGGNLTSAYGAYSPNFAFDATHHYESTVGSFDPLKFNPYQPAELTSDKLGSDLSGKVPFGFSYDFNGSVNRLRDNTDFNGSEYAANFSTSGIRVTNDNNAVVGLNMQQHLLKDFWIDSDREVLLVRGADLKISQQALRFKIMTILLGVELSYFDLIGAREEIQVQAQALDLRRQFLVITQRRVQVGELPPLEDVQAQTQLQNTLTQLAAARQAFATRQNHLAGLLTDDFKSWADAELQPTDPLQAPPVAVNRSDSFQSALSRRPDLIEARLEVQKNGTLVQYRLNQLFPNVDLVGGYGGLGSEPQSGSAALSDAFNFGNPEFTYGMVVSFPLDNASARGGYRASKAARQIAELQLKKAEQDVLLQVADYVSGVEFSFSQVTSTHQARTCAEEALEAETKKFQNGFATSFEVLQFQEILTAARTAEMRARVDYNKLLAQLAFAEGAILDRNHLSLEVK